MRVILVHNPVAGSTTQGDEDELLGLIRGAGHEVSCCAPAELEKELTKEPGAEPRAELIAVAGGDGTAGRIARQLVGCGIPLTFLPLGTANNIARSFGLADRPVEELIAGWVGAKPRRIDVGVIDGPWGPRYFIEGVGLGLFVRTMIEIDTIDALSHLTSPKERVSHAMTLLGDRLATFPARHLSLMLDGKDLSGEYLMLEAMNIRFVGPNLYIAPEGDPSDGLLDIVLVAERERQALLRHLVSWQRGKLPAHDFMTYKGKHLEIEWHGSALHVDDEAWPPAGEGHPPLPTPIDIGVRPGALELLLPGQKG
jgi:diacylglycerol kinase (ATP)